jgi:TP901 family phage tail tape measure protein
MGSISGAIGSLWVEIGAKISNFESAMGDVSKKIDATVREVGGLGAGAAGAFDDIGKGAVGAKAPLAELEAAFRNLGIKSSAELDTLASDAKRDYDTIKNSGTASARDLELAWGKLQSASKAASAEASSSMLKLSKDISQTVKDAEEKFSGFEKVGASLTSVGTRLSAAITLPLIGIGAAAIKASSDFDSAMRLVSARGDITGADLAKLKAQAEDLGAKTQFSSKQAAEGMAELAGAGFKTSEVFAAMPGIMNLAAASGSSVGDAAKVTKDILGQFGIAATDTSRAVDVMTKAGNASSGTLGEMANSLKYVGPVAHDAGLSLEQTSAALLLLDKAGIRGEQAGTSLRSVLLSLQGPTDAAQKIMTQYGIAVKDAGGNMLPLPQILDNFRVGLEKIPGTADKAAALTKVFGENAETAASKLIKQGSPALNQFTDDLLKASGEAERTASVMNSGLGGALEKMKGSVETASQKIGDAFAPQLIALTGMLESSANKVAEFAGWFGKLPEPIQTTTLALLAFAAAGGPMLIIIGQLAGAVTNISALLALKTTALTALTAATGLSTIAMAAWTAGIGAAVLAIGYLVVKYNQMKDAQEGAKTAEDGHMQSLDRLEKSLRSQGGAVDALKQEYKQGQISLDQYEAGLRKIAVEVGNSKKATDSHTKALSDAEKAHQAVTKALAAATTATKAHGEETKTAKEHVKNFSDSGTVLAETIKQIGNTYNSSLTALVKWKLAHQDAASITPKLTETTKELDAAIMAMVSSAKLIAPAFLDAGAQAKASLEAAAKPIRDLDAAYRTLGVTSTDSLKKQADEAARAYATILASGEHSASDLDAAWAKMEEARIAAAKSAGEIIPAEVQKQLDEVQGKIDTHTQDTKGLWSDWSDQVSTIITDLGKNITDVLWDGSLSWGEKGKKVLSELGQSVMRAFVEPATKAMADLMSGVISDLIGGKGFGGIVDKVKELGSSIAGVFGGGGKDIVGEVTGTAGGPAASIPGTGGGAGGAAGAAAGSSIAGIAGAVGSIAGAVSGIIGNFQNAHQETSLNAIEHNTRYSMMYLGERGDGGILGAMFKVQENTQYLPAQLDGLNQKLIDWLQPLDFRLGQISEQITFAQTRFDTITQNTGAAASSLESNRGVLQSILAEIRNLAGNVPVINVYVDGQKQAAKTDSSLKMQGVLAI